MILWLASKRAPLDETSRCSLSSLLFYVAVICIFLGALRIVGIPLTAFAFLGGAVAIGIGFGTQNLFKNLISGILLMLKRPFRIGNVIEAGDVSGVVSKIGVEVTVVRTFDGKDVLIPNSSLLENRVVNWELSDALIRCSIDVGVRYGTPADLVEETLLAIVGADPRILATPEPWVCFSDFGKSELCFTLLFWINQRSASKMRVCSDVRKLIQKKFAEAGIEIAYPHLDVTLLRGEPEPAKRDVERPLKM